jgi:NAD+ kinase
MTARSVLLVAHATRPEAQAVAREVVAGLVSAGIQVRATESDAAELQIEELHAVPADEHAADDTEIVVVLGGDGTILRGAERARFADVPLLGVNLGRVGFLAEAERDEAARLVTAIVDRTWTEETRVALDVRLFSDGQETARTWALNEISVEKQSRARMIEVRVEIDGRPLSRWGCDGVVCATPTGSTAYAFSAGGPVVWPEVEALLVVPLSAHALFARPLVVAPTSVIAFDLSPASDSALVCADGRRTLAMAPGSRVEIRRHEQPVRLARLHLAPFTDRLVAKFNLSVEGWRGRTDPE